MHLQFWIQRWRSRSTMQNLSISLQHLWFIWKLSYMSFNKVLIFFSHKYFPQKQFNLSFLLHRYLSNGDCLCDTGLFESGLTACSGCSTLCADCITDKYTCTDCNETSDFRILNQLAWCVCKDGYFDTTVYDSSNIPLVEVPKCEKCIHNCKTCTNNQLYSCLSCYTSYNYVLTAKVGNLYFF